MRIAIVGTGNVAKDCYLPFLKTQKDVELAYFSRTPAKAEACAAACGGKAYASLRDLLATDPDAVFVLTNETTRADVLAELVPLKPRRLFLEKPLVARNGQDNVTEEDFTTAQRLLAQLHAQGCQTAMIFNYRFFDQIMAAREIVEKRAFGTPLNAVVATNYACWSHSIDLLHYFVGPAETIVAQESGLKCRSGKGEVADIAGSIRFVGGASGTILGTWALNFGFPLFELIVNFTGGRFHARCLDGDLEVLDYSTKRHETLSVTRNTSRWDQYRASFGKSIAAYLESMRRGEPPPVPGQAGLDELRFEAALRRSVRLGRAVQVQSEFPI
jgi:myo-inositol 2-dehydrogenase / D-chiro-inositol 1-dehydrogenase